MAADPVDVAELEIARNAPDQATAGPCGLCGHVEVRVR